MESQQQDKDENLFERDTKSDFSSGLLQATSDDAGDDDMSEEDAEEESAADDEADEDV